MTTAPDDIGTEIRREVEVWAEDTKALLSSCRQLISYFGTRDETTSWDAAATIPKAYVDIVVAIRPDSGKESLRRPGTPETFECSEVTAKIIAPLVQVISGPVPAFIRRIRASGLSDAQKVVTLAFGCFAAAFGDCISEPLWQKYPGHAPREWLELNPDRAPAANRNPGEK